MTTTSAQDVASDVVGEICWRAGRGHGSFITFDFGRLLPGPNRERGEWHLWVYFGDWTLREGGRVLATTWDDYPVIDTGIERFTGKRLDGVRIDADTLDTTFVFENSLTLDIGPNTDDESPDADWWLLFTPGEQVLVIGPGPAWTHRSSIEP